MLLQSFRPPMWQEGGNPIYEFPYTAPAPLQIVQRTNNGIRHYILLTIAAIVRWQKENYCMPEVALSRLMNGISICHGAYLNSSNF